MSDWEQYKKEIASFGGKVPEDWYILGVDLGTTNSVISYWDNVTKRPEPIDASNGFGKIPLPSVVQFRKDDDSSDGEWIVGEEAYRSMKIYPETTIRSIKRKMGTNETVRIDGKDYLPEEISAKILVSLIEQCKSINPKAEIAGVVVSVPYDFDDAAKRATMRACEIAGLSESLICLIEEPKAAALNYNCRHELSQGESILVFDFGGGTLDITLFRVSEKTDSKINIQVISEGGEAYHGGDNVDEIIFNKCCDVIFEKIKQKKEDISVENLVETAVRAREAKERLSGAKSCRISFTFCIPPFVEQMTREQFEELLRPFIEKTHKLVQKALREAYTGAVSPDSVSRVLLEGGSSSMPWVKDMLLGIFNDENKLFQPDRPALDISLGATYYAAMKMGLLTGQDISAETASVEFEVTVPHDIGLEIVNCGKKAFFPMIKRGVPYTLAKKSHIFTLSGETDAEMTTFDLKIMEKIDKNDSIENCKLIGEVSVNGLPVRPSGKTRLQITLSVEEEGGLVRGVVEDLGFGTDFPKSGYRQSFEPHRFAKTKI
jgi:molecular chaperone DnaK